MLQLITGMHHSFIAVETTLIADQAKQVDHLFSQSLPSNVAQGGVSSVCCFLNY